MSKALFLSSTNFSPKLAKCVSMQTVTHKCNPQLPSNIHVLWSLYSSPWQLGSLKPSKDEVFRATTAGLGRCLNHLIQNGKSREISKYCTACTCEIWMKIFSWLTYYSLHHGSTWGCGLPVWKRNTKSCHGTCFSFSLIPCIKYVHNWING